MAPLAFSGVAFRTLAEPSVTTFAQQDRLPTVFLMLAGHVSARRLAWFPTRHDLSVVSVTRVAARRAGASAAHRQSRLLQEG